MAMNKTARESKAKDGSFTKEAVAKGSSARTAAPQKAAGPKLTEWQKVTLEKVRAHADPLGYRAEKKRENKTLETLLKHKLVRRGKKHAESGYYYYRISN